MVCGFIHVMPHFISPGAAPPQQGTSHLPFVVTADEEHYLVQLHTAFTGRYSPGNRYLFEHRNTEEVEKKFLLDGINAQGLIGSLLCPGFHSFIIMSRFIFPLIAFFLMVALFHRLFKKPFMNALVFASLTILAPYGLFGHLHFVDRLVVEYLLKSKGVWSVLFLNAHLPWSRLVNPQFTGLFFLGVLYLMILFVLKSKSAPYLALSLPLIWLTYKFYFYFWSSLLVFSGILFITALVLRKRRVWLPMLGFSLIGGGFIILQLPQLLDLTVEPHASSFTFSLLRKPIVSPTVIICIVLLVVYLTVKKRLTPEEHIIFFASVLTPIVCINQQIVSGRVVQLWHYELFTNPIFCWIAAALLWKHLNVSSLIENYIHPYLVERKGIRALIYAILIILFLTGSVGYVLFHRSWSGTFSAGVVTSCVFYIGLWLSLTLGILSILVSVMRGKSKTWRNIAITVIFILVIGEGLERQTYMTLRRLPEYRRQQSYAGAINWLQANSPPDSVVAAPFEITEILPAVADTYVYIAKNAVHYTLSQVEREQRVAEFFYCRDMTEEEVAQAIRTYPYRYILWGLRYFSPESYDLYSFGEHDLITHKEAEQFLARYRHLRETGIQSSFTYRLDYILLPSDERPNPSLTIEKEYADADAIIYRVVLK